MEYLTAFNFEIHYRKGSTNLADSLSYQPNYELRGVDNNELLLPILQQKLQGTTALKEPKTIATVWVWMAWLVQKLPVSCAESTMEVDSTEGEDTATETIVSIIKSILAQADAVMQEDMPSYPKDAADMGAANLPSEMDEDDKSRQGNGKMLLTLQ